MRVQGPCHRASSDVQVKRNAKPQGESSGPGGQRAAPRGLADSPLGLALLFIALAAVLPALAGCQSGASPPPIVLGHVANLSGVEPFGRHAEQGIDLALKEAVDANIAEALDGRPLRVRHTDTRGRLDAYESEAVRLVSLNRIIGSMGGARRRRSRRSIAGMCRCWRRAE